MWNYTHKPRFPTKYIEQIERDPKCLVGTTWIHEAAKLRRKTVIVIRAVVLPYDDNYPISYVRFSPALPCGTGQVFLSYFMEYCVPWTPSTAPTAWERLLDDAL